MDFSKIVNDPKTTLVDVREAYEFRAGHAPGSINIPLGSLIIRMEEFIAMPGPIVFFCRSGNRSEHAKILLQAKGFKEVFNGGSVGDILYFQSMAEKRKAA